MEGQFEGQNPAMATQESKSEGDMLSESKNHFQAILQLLQLIDTLLPEDKHKNYSDKLNHGTRDNRKSFDFVDSITNLILKLWQLLPVGVCIQLMALSWSTHQAKSLPMRKHRYVHSILIYLVFLKFIQPAPMDIEEELLSNDLYDASAGQHLQVATVANSRFFNPKDFPDSRLHATTLFEISNYEFLDDT